MSKQAKTLAAMAGIIVVLAVVLVFVMALPEKEGPEPVYTTGGYDELFKVETSAITSIAVSNAEGSFVAQKQEDDTWMIEGLEAFAKDDTAYSDLVDTASAFQSTRVVEENPEDLEKYGLSPAQATIDITCEDGTTQQFRVGDMAPTGDGYYAQLGDSQTVHLVRVANLEMALKGERAYIDTLITPSASNTSQFPLAHTIQIEQEGAQTITIEPEDPDAETVNSYLFTQPFEARLDNENGSDFLYSFFGIAADEVVCISPTQEQIAEYGLDAPAIHFVLTYELIGDEEEGKIYTVDASLSAADEEGYCYMQVQGVDLVYKIAQSALPFLDYTFENLVSRDLYIPDYEQVEGFSVIFADGDRYDFTLTEEDGALKGESNGVEISSDVMTSFYNVLVGSRGENYIGQTDVSQMQEQMRIEYHLKDGTDDVLRFVTYDERMVMPVLNEEDGFFTMRVAFVEKIRSDCQKVLNGQTVTSGY